MLVRIIHRLAGLILSIALFTSSQLMAACPSQFCNLTCQLCALVNCHHGGGTACIYSKTQPVPTSNPCSYRSDICNGTQECWSMMISFHYTECNDELRVGEVFVCCKVPN